MLIELTIRNIALIESLCIEFAQGFNVLTGETGSGKSIVVDCVNLVLGGRADRDFVRTGAEKGSVQALFDIAGNDRAKRFADELGIDYSDGMIAVSREISRSGRNICRISGVIVPLSTLKQLMSSLLDIHGQHVHQSLLSPMMHIEFLDAFGCDEHQALRKKVAALHAERSSIASSLKKLMKDSAEKERLADMLSFQVNEITAAKLKKGEEEKLTARLRILENSEKIQSCVENAYVMTYRGDGRMISAQEALLRAADSMESLASIDKKYADLSQRLRELYYSVQDIGYELQDVLDHLSYNPSLIDKIAERLDLISKLERKYGPNLEDVIAFGEQAVARLAAIQSCDASIEAQKRQLAQLDNALKTACEALTASRRELAEKLAASIVEQLRDLGMGKTRFEIRVDPEPKPTANGADSVEFMISPNPGEPLKPLATVASGGELSRIMLAMKAIAMDIDGVNSMVFDEIDTGVSGRMAQVVGEKMCRIACNRQVLCVTHLPQIAALGNAHYLVEKYSDTERTETIVSRLDDAGRIREISRLVGGAEDSQSSLSHASHMLQESQEICRSIQS